MSKCTPTPPAAPTPKDQAPSLVTVVGPWVNQEILALLGPIDALDNLTNG